MAQALAQMCEQQRADLVAVAAPIAEPPDEMEALDAAILEVQTKIAANGPDNNYLWGRLTELESGRKELRRRRARSYLDAYLPPVRFFSIEEEQPQSANLFQWLTQTWRQLWA
jgi:hypothetical protein